MWRVWHPDHPTFYLHPDELGIVSENHARRIAAKMLACDVDRVHVSHVEVDE